MFELGLFHFFGPGNPDRRCRHSDASATSEFQSMAKARERDEDDREA